MSRAGKQPGVTHHAIEAFASKWRPLVTVEAAAAELAQLVEQAVPTRLKSLRGDGVIWLCTTPAGERVPLVVRDSTIVTVLAPGQGGLGSNTNVQDHGADDDLAEESRRTRAACQAMVQGLATDTADFDRLKADERRGRR